MGARYVIKKLLLPGRKKIVSDVVDAIPDHVLVDTELGNRPDDVFFLRFSKCSAVDDNTLKFAMSQGQDRYHLPLSSFQFCCPQHAAASKSMIGFKKLNLSGC